MACAGMMGDVRLLLRAMSVWRATAALPIFRPAIARPRRAAGRNCASMRHLACACTAMTRSSHRHWQLMVSAMAGSRRACAPSRHPG